MSEIRIVQSEACKLMRSIPEDSVQVVIADPPYGIAYHSNYYVGKNPHAPVARDWNFQIGEFLNVAGRALRVGGVLYLFTRWDVYPLWASSVMPPLDLKNVIVWKKDNWSAGDLAGDFGNQYELLMMLTKGKHVRRGHRWSNVWEFARVPAKKMLHPTQKPVELVRRAIEASSDIGDLVVDPFSGSGTTGEAARSCERQALIADLDPTMVRLSCSRLGLVVPDGVEECPTSELPSCPIFGVQQPDLSLWGLHPEDLVDFRTKWSSTMLVRVTHTIDSTGES
jgi:site-specific DNA-methyltransferase (adenine-specific)